MLHRLDLLRTDVSEELRLFVRSVRRLLVTANVFPSSLILVTLTMEALRSSETSVITRASKNTPLVLPKVDDLASDPAMGTFTLSVFDNTSLF
jgi:hypothetical protein